MYFVVMHAIKSHAMQHISTIVWFEEVMKVLFQVNPHELFL